MTNDKKVLLGSALAALTLAAAGCAGGMAGSMKQSASSSATKPQGTMIAKGECSGINACKGTGECGGVGHGCAGKNACKGQGWVSKTEADCKAAGGSFKAQ